MKGSAFSRTELQLSSGVLPVLLKEEIGGDQFVVC